MNRTRFALSVIAASAITASAASAVTGSAFAGAAADPDAGTEVLNLLCSEARGTAIWTPYTVARCQGAAARSGVDIERLVCEGLLGGQFSVAASTTRPNRVNWACVSGAPSA